jgi:hypothetical protein
MSKRKNDCPYTTSVKNIINRSTPEFIRNGAISPGAEKQMEQERLILRNWELICGKELARHLRPGGFENNSFTIEADSGLWLEQARFLECEILKRIRELFPRTTMKKITFRVNFFQKKSTCKNSKEGKDFYIQDKNPDSPQKKRRRKIRMLPARTPNKTKEHHRTTEIIKEFLELFHN